MSLLNITNLTNNPIDWIQNKYIDAFAEYYQSDDFLASKKDRLSSDDEDSYIDDQLNNLENLMNESKGSELLGIVDNFLVNNDYYADVKEFIENQ